MSSRVNPSIRSKSYKDEPDEVKNLRKLHSTQLSTLKELFADWSDEDLLFAVQEAGGDLELAIDRISDGHTSQWGEVKGKKTKKPHNERSANTQPQVDKYQFSIKSTGSNERAKTSQIKAKGPRIPKPVEKPRVPAPTPTPVKPVMLDSQGNAKTYAQLASQAQKPPQDSDFSHTPLKNEKQDVPDVAAWGPTPSAAFSVPSWGPSKSKPESQGRSQTDTVQASNPQNEFPTLSTPSKPITQPKISWAQIVNRPVVNSTPSASATKTDSTPVKPQEAETHITSPENTSSESAKVQDSVEPESETKLPENIQAEPQEESKPDTVSISEELTVESEEPIENAEEEIEEPKETIEPVAIPAGTEETDASEAKEQNSNLNTETSKVQAASPNSKARMMNPRKFKQDSPVVMPGGSSSLERIGVQFGSLSLSSLPDRNAPVSQVADADVQDEKIDTEFNEPEEQFYVETQEVQPQVSVPEMQPVIHNLASTLMDSAPVSLEASAPSAPIEVEEPLKPKSPEPVSMSTEATNGANNSAQATQPQNPKVEMTSNNAQNQTMYPTQPSVLPNMNAFGRQNGQHNSPYLGQQPHIGNPDVLNSSPYGTYMGGQPQSQFSNFGMGPMTDYGAALYGNDAQRALMGYYADPSYGQIPSSYQRDNRLPTQDPTAIPSTTQSAQNASLTSQASPQPQQLQQPSYPELAGIPYYPYYYVPNQFHSPAYQQSGYGQPFMNKNVYPFYGNQQTNKPGSSGAGSPYTSTGYPSNTLSQQASYTQGPPGVSRYDDMSLGGSANSGMGGGVSDYQKGYKSDLPLQGFLGSTSGQQQVGTTEASKNASGQNTHEMNSPYKNYADPSSVYGQSAQGGQYGGYQQQMYGGYQQQYPQQTQQQYQTYHMQQQNHQQQQQQQSGGYHHQQGRNQGYWS
ncbi:RNAPII degradation factor [Basidiobolus ranarum]|uniref:RNA polymerase II degradation factor 1 n=1 Tax=Basidiobolus ranarum TaxID=34480 RepID=A0ABR2X2S7_9FUNG